MILETFDLNYLFAFPARGENWALFPVVDVQGFRVEGIVKTTAEVTDLLVAFFLRSFLTIIVLLGRRLALELLLVGSHLEVLLVRTISLILLVIIWLGLLFLLLLLYFLPIFTLLLTTFSSCFLLTTTRVNISRDSHTWIRFIIVILGALASIEFRKWCFQNIYLCGSQFTEVFSNRRTESPVKFYHALCGGIPHILQSMLEALDSELKSCLQWVLLDTLRFWQHSVQSRVFSDDLLIRIHCLFGGFTSLWYGCCTDQCVHADFDTEGRVITHSKDCVFSSHPYFL